MKRICIYTKDIQIITGRSERYCRNLIAEIKKTNNKEKHQPVTVQEFCHYMGLEPTSIQHTIR